MEDPHGCQQSDSTHAQPREEARLPRSPRHPHLAGSRQQKPPLPGFTTCRPPPPACPAGLALAGLEPTGLLLMMDLNDGVLASAFNVRDTRLSRRFGLTSAPPASSCSQSVTPQLPQPHPPAASPAAGSDPLEHPAEPQHRAHCPPRAAPHIPPDLNAIITPAT